MMVTVMLKMKTVTLMLLVVRVVMTILNHVICVVRFSVPAIRLYFSAKASHCVSL